ncbi:MAG TPA: hypothetical protein DHW82_04670 [Spirochaetia bacterium]|nr:MAG: hypothetical protein A2Y41_08510 [Spirochaetes bacterium GWB1_36_13]HCL56287.1 hypothetical protein [Spirochaetia bacterium]
MGNERKISEHKNNKDVQIFLKEDLLPSMTKVPIYSLDDEFEKTKKNKNLRLYVITALFIAFIVLGAFFLLYVYNQNRIVQIDINDFQDINLTELLNNAKKNEAKLLNLKEELENLKQEMNFSVFNAKDDTSREIELLMAKSLPSAEKEEILKKLKQEEKSKMVKLMNDYQEQISAKQDEISKVQKEVDSYNQKIASDAERVENVINNYQRIHDYQMNKQKSYYDKLIESLKAGNKKQISLIKRYHQEFIDSLILKYNPVFEGEEFKNILSEELEKEGIVIDLENLNADISSEGLLSPAEFEKIKLMRKDFDLLFKKIKEIPYINSIPYVLDHFQYHFESLSGSYSGLLKRTAEVIAKKDKQIQEKNTVIKKYQDSIDLLAQDERENGYIIFKDGSGIEAVVQKGYPIADDTKAFVFRGDQEWIATVRLKKNFDSVTAEIIEKAEGKDLRSFDKLLLIIQ